MFRTDLGLNASLLRQLVLRDLRLRYRSTFLGFLWSLVKPGIMIAIFYLVFQMFPGIRDALTDFPGASYGVYLAVGIISWSFLSTTLNLGVASYVNHQHLINRAAFWRPVLPLAGVVSNWVHYGFAQLVLVTVLGFLGYHAWGWELLYIVGLNILEVLLAVSLVWIFAWFQVLVRDTYQFVELGIMLWFYASPIIYPASLPLLLLETKHLEFLYLANPMAPVLIFRQRLLMSNYLAESGALVPSPGQLNEYLLLSLLVTMILAAAALGLNRKVNHRIADRL